MQNYLLKFNAFRRLLLCILFFSLSGTLQAEPSQLKSFTPGSYQQMLTAHKDQAFMLVIWSLTCPSCVKDMALLNELHKSRSDIKMVMLATDELSESPQVQALLAKNNLADLENWIYADDNTQKLNYEIDPQWYGEQPRTYFFDANHHRVGISGVITKADYEALFVKMQKSLQKAP